jgi:hypothetical protein
MNTEEEMKQVSLAASALLFASVFTTGPVPASAGPMHAVTYAPHSAIVTVLCRYGSPNCVNPNPGPKGPKVNTTRLPDSGWTDPDCKHYGNCNTGRPGSWGDPAAARAGSSMPSYGVQPGMRMHR